MQSIIDKTVTEIMVKLKNVEDRIKQSEMEIQFLLGALDGVKLLVANLNKGEADGQDSDERPGDREAITVP